VVILSEAKDLLVIQINDLQILRRPWLLRMTALGEFFNKLLGGFRSVERASPLEGGYTLYLILPPRRKRLME
jgi:hypothetical protein